MLNTGQNIHVSAVNILNSSAIDQLIVLVSAPGALLQGALFFLKFTLILSEVIWDLPDIIYQN